MSYTGLEIWKLSKKLTLDIHSMTVELPIYKSHQLKVSTIQICTYSPEPRT